MSQDTQDLEIEELKIMSDDYRYRDQLMVTEFGLSMTAIALAANAAFRTTSLNIQLLIFSLSLVFAWLIANHMTRINVDRLSAGTRRRELLNALKMHSPHMGFERKQVKFTFPAPIALVGFCWLTVIVLAATVAYLAYCQCALPIAGN